jgi:hypothetical protein
MSTEREALHAQIMNVPPTKGIFDTLTTEAERGAYMVGHRDARHAAAELVAAATSAHSASGWQAMKTAPRDGTNILLRWGTDGASQGKYIPGLPKPWQFIDTNDGITWLINYAVDNEYGPTHWQPMPQCSAKEQQ